MGPVVNLGSQRAQQARFAYVLSSKMWRFFARHGQFVAGCDRCLAAHDKQRLLLVCNWRCGLAFHDFGVVRLVAARFAAN